MPDIQGILSQWSKIEGEIRTGVHEDFGKSKDIQDILDIIHDLQLTANTVSPLRELFNQHLEDFNNPHEVTINIQDLDVLKVLYNLYSTKYGQDMSMVEFGYALVNIKRFATKLDVDNQTNLDSLLNMDVMNYIIDNHDESPEAHTDLFRHKLPGTPLSSPPSEVFEPAVSLVTMFTVERACPMNYHDINGRVKEVPEHTLAIDYAYGIPAAPIFGAHRNILLNSRALGDVTFHGAARNAGTDLFVLTPNDDMVFLLLEEDGSLGNHGFNDIVPEEQTGVNNYVVYCYPLTRDKCLINIKAGSEIIGSAIYDCRNETTQISSDVLKLYATVNSLPNGWFRLSITYDASDVAITSFDVDVIAEIDTTNPFNNVYQGTMCNAMCFWQHQITQTALPVPPIYTEAIPKTVLGTKVRRRFDDIFNPIHGSFVVRYLSSLPELFGDPCALLRVGNNETMSTVVEIESNFINPTRNRIVSYNINNEILEMFDSEAYSATDISFVKRVAFTYGLGFQGYGFTDQKPQISSTNIDDVTKQTETFFQSIYNGSNNYNGQVFILQLPEGVIDPDATDLNLIPGTLANTSTYRINMDASVLELGYNSKYDLYMNGYLINFRYYSVFASKMNIEFLLDQYIP